MKRFHLFKRKVTNNLRIEAFCLKADIKHYFQEVNHQILLNILKRKIKDNDTFALIELILNNNVKSNDFGIGMPLGNYTSQFFANVYLNELDYFVKYELKAKYYIRYVDDFVILHPSTKQLEKWKILINQFLKEKLILELHPDKSKIISLSKSIDFVGFRNFYHFKLPRKRNIKKMENKIYLFNNKINYKDLMTSFQGWNSYVKWSNSFKIRKNMLKIINKIKILVSNK